MRKTSRVQQINFFILERLSGSQEPINSGGGMAKVVYAARIPKARRLARSEIAGPYEFRALLIKL